MAGFQYFQVSDSNHYDQFSMKKTLRGIVIAFVVTFAFLAGFSLYLTYSDVNTAMIPVLAAVILYLGSLMAGLFASVGSKNKGWFSGLVAGAIYMLIVFIVGALIQENYAFSMKILYHLLISCVIGAFGGIVGINLKTKRRK